MADPFRPQGPDGPSIWEVSGPEVAEKGGCTRSLNLTFDRDRGLDVVLAGEGIDGVVTFPKAVTDSMLTSEGEPPGTELDVQAVLTRRALDVIANTIGGGAGAAAAPPTGFEGQRFDVSLEGDLITGSLSLSGPAVELILGEAPTQAVDVAVEDAVAGKIADATSAVVGEELPGEAYAPTGPVDEEASEPSAEAPDASTAIGEPAGFGEGAPDSEMEAEAVQASAGEPEGFGEGAGPTPMSPGSGDVANVDLQNLQAQTAGDDAQAPAEEEDVGEAPTVEEVPIELAPPEQDPLQDTVTPPVEEVPPEEAEEPPPEG